MKKLLFLGFILSAMCSFAQDKVKFTKEQLKKMDDYLFDEALAGGSKKKPSTVILKDGNTITGNLKDLDFKKGLINSVEIDVNGKATEYKSNEIAELYLPVSGLAKAIAVNKYMSSSKNWGRKNLNKSTNPDQVYLRNLKTSIKNKKFEDEYLLQLINPDFSARIEVYSDPRAKESASMSFGMGGIMSPGVGGGVTKSYYIKKGDDVFWLDKSSFKDNYNMLFGDNEEFMKKYPYNSIKWEHFSYLVMEYTRLSEEG